jgi:uncharacterized protein YjbI with pentapeptide repeats
MAEQRVASGFQTPSWPVCDTEACIGIRLDGLDACLAHADEEARKRYLAGLRSNAPVDLRGTSISPILLREILAATRTKESDAALADVQFNEARFIETALFHGVQFSGDALFEGAQFTADAVFDGAQFIGKAVFDGAQFTGKAGFNRAVFSKTLGSSGRDSIKRNSSVRSR